MSTTTIKGITFTSEPNQQSMSMSRIFDAPRDLVFKAHTDPSMLPNWWGPRIYKTVVDKLEARPGGEWRFLNIDDDGNEYGFHGVYHTVTPECIVQTFEFEGVPGHVAMDTYYFEDLGDNKTKLTAVSVFQSTADRDAMGASGAQEGGIETWERLAEILQSTAVPA